MAQPWEGIDGINRENCLLSLGDEAAEHRDALMRVARLLRTTCLVGNRAPVVDQLWERVAKPVPGDLVVEVTRAIYRFDYQGLGILLACRREHEVNDDVWYIQYGNDHRDIARWVNCEFMALPVQNQAAIYVAG